MAMIEPERLSTPHHVADAADAADATATASDVTVAEAPLPDLGRERALLTELETELAAIDAELRTLDGTS